MTLDHHTQIGYVPLGWLARAVLGLGAATIGSPGRGAVLPTSSTR